MFMWCVAGQEHLQIRLPLFTFAAQYCDRTAASGTIDIVEYPSAYAHSPITTVRSEVAVRPKRLTMY